MRAWASLRATVPPAAGAGLFGTPVNPFAPSPAPANFKVGDKVKALPGIESQSIPSRYIGQIGTVMSCGSSLGVKFGGGSSLFGSSESTWMTSPQYVERAGGLVIPAAPPAATATGGGDASEGCFDLSASKGGNSIKLSDGDATATIGARDSWAVTKQALSTSGAFSFVLLNDNKDDEGSCFGIVPERHLGSLPDRQHDSRAIDGGAYFRSYEGKVADCSGGGSTAVRASKVLCEPSRSLPSGRRWNWRRKSRSMLRLVRMCMELMIGSTIAFIRALSSPLAAVGGDVETADAV